VRSFLSVLLGALVLGLAGTTAAFAGSQPFDSSAPLTSGTPAAATLFATPLFLPGEVDLAALGVPASELAGVGLAGAASSSAGDGPNMFIVDDDHAQCPNAAYSRIQDAVDAAPPGAQIKVCPGTYPEQVRITKNNLTLFSEIPLKAVIQAPVVLTYPNSVVTVSGATGVTIRQFTISGPYVAVDPGACAGLTDRHTGVRIVNGSATIFGNHITKIRDANPALFGCQDGIAVLVGRQFEGQVGNALLQNNLIDQYQKGGVVVDNAGSYAQVTQNEITGEGLTPITAQNGVQVGRGASADVDHNEISRNQFARVGFTDTAAGVLLFETDAHVSTDHNDVFQNGVGIDVDADTVGLTIAHNNVSQSINDGIAAFDGSVDNVISFNKAFNNTPFDCYDETTGPYPPGTANNWLKDMGLTQNRPGLCKKAS
jgi:parallel beta helix pectate lyase-like protein